MLRGVARRRSSEPLGLCRIPKIALSKAATEDMEMAITHDPLFDQVMIIGEGKPCLAALVVLSQKHLELLLGELGLDRERDYSTDEKLENALLERIAELICEFPGYAKIRHVGISGERWDIDNGMMTPTLKLKRNRILEKHAAVIERLYARRCS
jgi:long-chain acyl-CoA synthetase